MRRLIPFALLLAHTSSVRGADWQPVTTELLKKEKPGYGGLSGVAVDHATGHIFVESATTASSARPTRARPGSGSARSHQGPHRNAGLLATRPDRQDEARPDGDRLRRAGRARINRQGRMANARQGEHARRLVRRGLVRPGHEVPARAQARVGRHAASLARRRQELRRSRQGLRPGRGSSTPTRPSSRWRRRRIEPKGSLLRTTDGGKTFEPVAEYAPTSLPRWHGDALYWLRTVR